MNETATKQAANGRHTHPANPVTQQDIADFQRDGVICLRGMFGPEWCDMLRDASLEAMENGAGRVREPKTEPGKGRFYSNVYLSDLDERFRLLRDASPAAEIAATLLECDSVRFYYDQLFIKTPGTSAPTPWHNDLPFWPFRGNDLISLWIALSPVSAETSGVQYVAGSHRWNKMFRAVTPDYDPRFLDPELEECPDYGSPDTPSAGKVLSWNMQPGDVLCHHPLTVHGASGNASATQTRIGLSIRYLGRDVQWDPRPHTMKLRRTPEVAQGEYPADDIAFPVIWDRRDGHLQPDGPAA
ncbi:phytanoyl-CoA dioxygenase family protein [Pusillimonas noertemannii]|uniref:phytanoyl-CoA dioxygenase family protein n=1 Tax=Pusillimonas noertemannii TaxID=305977 RepID=UPI0002DD93AB|nr:phytanoyl-CoA dioxygenase family protein [Pusillimonas noertemannii]